jgi:TonB family protein
MVITVNTDGRVLHTEVVQSSGQADLDRRAQAIATAAGPFGNFTPAMRKQADQLAIVSRFIFSRNNTLETRGGEGVQPPSWAHSTHHRSHHKSFVQCFHCFISWLNCQPNTCLTD